MSEARFGVFLRPDPETCFIQSQINLALVQQFGIVSAAAYPPHATLVGSLRTNATVAELIALVEVALADVSPIRVFNAGIQRSGAGWAYNIDEDGAGEPNAALHDVAARVMAALEPVALPNEDSHTERFSPGTFRAHLSLASHDLIIKPQLVDEVGEFLQGLPLQPPERFVADTVSLFEFSSDDWRGQWWHTLTWQHLHSWRLS